MGQYFTTSEAARLCQVSAGSVVRWIRESKLKAAVTAGGHHRIQKADLAEFMCLLGMPMPNEWQNSLGKETNQTSKILILGDVPETQEMMAQFFEKEYQGIELCKTESDFQAGWITHKQLPDLVILNPRMHEDKGYEICKMIKLSPELQHTKVLAIAEPGEGHRKAIMDLGADDFLEKPFNLIQLRQVVSHLLEESGRQGR